MKAVIIGLVAASAVASVAHAGVSSKQFVEASRCSALAASDNLGKLDTTAVEAFLRGAAAEQKYSVRVDAITKMNNTRRKADGATGSAKAKLLAEREQVCAPYMASAQANP